MRILGFPSRRSQGPSLPHSFSSPLHGPWCRQRWWEQCSQTAKQKMRFLENMVRRIKLHSLLMFAQKHFQWSTWREGSSLAVQDSISFTPTSKRGLITPHLLSLPLSSTTILPERWSSTNSNSPMYPAVKRIASSVTVSSQQPYHIKILSMKSRHIYDEWYETYRAFAWRWGT